MNPWKGVACCMMRNQWLPLYTNWNWRITNLLVSSGLLMSIFLINRLTNPGVARLMVYCLKFRMLKTRTWWQAPVVPAGWVLSSSDNLARPGKGVLQVKSELLQINQSCLTCVKIGPSSFELSPICVRNGSWFLYPQDRSCCLIVGLSHWKTVAFAGNPDRYNSCGGFPM